MQKEESGRRHTEPTAPSPPQCRRTKPTPLEGKKEEEIDEQGETMETEKQPDSSESEEEVGTTHERILNCPREATHTNCTRVANMLEAVTEEDTPRQRTSGQRSFVVDINCTASLANGGLD